MRTVLPEKYAAASNLGEVGAGCAGVAVGVGRSTVIAVGAASGVGVSVGAGIGVQVGAGVHVGIGEGVQVGAGVHVGGGVAVLHAASNRNPTIPIAKRSIRNPLAAMRRGVWENCRRSREPTRGRVRPSRLA